MADKSNKPLRQFGLVVGLGLGLVASLSWYRGHIWPPLVLGSAAAVLMLLGLAYPRALGPVEKAWMKLGITLAWVNTRVILTLLFTLVVTPIGAIARLFRDPLGPRFREDKPTYWLARESVPARPEIYERQF
ncbi:MAG: SxtJ family membrane protein [Acidobacteriota bacterium]